MAFKIADRVRESSSTTGTGAFTLTGAVTGFDPFASILNINGDTTWYCAQYGAEWEVGLGTRTSATVLARTTVLASSNADALVNFTAPPFVFITMPAAMLQYVMNRANHSGDFPANLTYTGALGSVGTSQCFSLVDIQYGSGGSANLSADVTTLIAGGSGAYVRLPSGNVSRRMTVFNDSGATRTVITAQYDFEGGGGPRGEWVIPDHGWATFVLVSTAFDDGSGWGPYTLWVTQNELSNMHGTLPVANGGTGVTSSTGTGSTVRSASPALTGVPTAPTAATATNSTQIATTAHVHAVVAALVDSSPGALDTLNELAAALGDDPNFATTVTNALAGKAALAGAAFTGDISVATLNAGQIVHAGTGGLLTTSPRLAYTVGNGVTSTGANDVDAVLAQTVRTSDSTALGYLGVEGSTPGTINADTLAYATVLASGASSRALQFGAAGAIRMSIMPTGEVLIGRTSKWASELLGVTGDDEVQDFSYFRTTYSGQFIKTGSDGIRPYLEYGNGSGFRFNDGTTARMEILAGGNLSLIGATNAGYRISTSGNVDARDWAALANVEAYGDFAIKQSNALGGDPVAAGTTRILITTGGQLQARAGFQADNSARVRPGSDQTLALVIDKAGSTASRLRAFVGTGSDGYQADEAYFWANNANIHFRTGVGGVDEPLTLSSAGVNVGGDLNASGDLNLGWDRQVSFAYDADYFHRLNSAAGTREMQFLVSSNDTRADFVWMNSMTGAAGLAERMRLSVNGLTVAGAVSAATRVLIGTTNVEGPDPRLYAFTNTDVWAAFFGDYNNSHLRVAGTATGTAGYSLLQSFANDETPGSKIVLQQLGGRVVIGDNTDDDTTLLQIHGDQKITADVAGAALEIYNASTSGYGLRLRTAATGGEAVLDIRSPDDSASVARILVNGAIFGVSGTFSYGVALDNNTGVVHIKDGGGTLRRALLRATDQFIFGDIDNDSVDSYITFCANLIQRHVIDEEQIGVWSQDGLAIEGVLEVARPAGGAGLIMDASTGTADTGMDIRWMRGGTLKWQLGSGFDSGSDALDLYDRIGDRKVWQAVANGAFNIFVPTNISNDLTVSNGGLFKITDAPTSSAGLPAGTVWSDGGTLKLA